MAKEETWTVQDSKALYRVKLRGESYFSVNAARFLEVQPVLGDPIGIELFKVVQDLRQQRIEFPLVIRFQDLLRSRVAAINTAFTEVHVYADDEEPDNYFVEKVIKGTTVQKVLAVIQYFPNDPQRRMKRLIQQKVKDGRIRPKVGVQLLDQYSKAFHEFTYLGPRELTGSDVTAK